MAKAPLPTSVDTWARPGIEREVKMYVFLIQSCLKNSYFWNSDRVSEFSNIGQIGTNNAEFLHFDLATTLCHYYTTPRLIIF